MEFAACEAVHCRCRDMASSGVTSVILASMAMVRRSAALTLYIQFLCQQFELENKSRCEQEQVRVNQNADHL
jgi:hypothetical protein